MTSLPEELKVPMQTCVGWGCVKISPACKEDRIAEYSEIPWKSQGEKLMSL